MIAALRTAAQDFIEPFEQSPNAAAGEWPRWPSTLDLVDTHLGGFYGQVSLASQGGAGKSMLAHASACQAATSPTGLWRVVEILAEMDEIDVDKRHTRYMEAHPECHKAGEMLTVHHVHKGITIEKLVEIVVGDIDIFYDDRVLVVIDSANTVAKWMPQGYLSALDELAGWTTAARRLSRGRCAFLVLNEQGRSGGVRGAVYEHWADIDIRMKELKENGGPVQLTFKKTRGGRIPQLEAKYIRNPLRGEFVPPDSRRQQRLHIVGGEDSDDGKGW